MQPDPAKAEKRRHPRHPVTSPVRFHQLKEKAFGGSLSVDISQGGICFLADRFFARGSLVRFVVPVSNEVFSLDGKTTYSTYVPTTGLYRTGVEFQNPETVYRDKLEEEIHQIREYQAMLSAELGYEVTEKEAAERWIEDCAGHFSFLL